MPARLIVHLEGRPSHAVMVREGSDCVLGRDPDCDVPVDDDRVSRRHARLAADGTGWRVHDLGSKNGTFSDGDPASGQRLGERVWLSLGGVLLEFQRLSEQALGDERAHALRRWTTSLHAQRDLVPSLGRERLLQRLLRSALEMTAGERGFVVLRRDGEPMQVAASEGVDESELHAEGFRGSVGAIERVLSTGVPVATADISSRPSLAGRPSIVERHIRALVCLPLDAGERRLGALYLDSRREGASFGELDVEILSALAGHAALAVAVTELQSELERVAAASALSDNASRDEARAPAVRQPSAEGPSSRATASTRSTASSEAEP